MNTQTPLDLSTLFDKAAGLTDGSGWTFPHPEKPEETVQVAEISTGRTLVSTKNLIDEYRTQPERLRATAKLHTLASLIDYAKRFKKLESALHASLFEPYRLTAKIDYHGMGADAAPSFNTHSAVYDFPLSEPMQAWMKVANGKLINQEEFAHFLEDREIDIHNPPADWMMLEASQLQLMLDLLNLRDDISPVDPKTGLYIGPDGKLLADEAPEPEEGYIPRKAVYKLRRKKFATSLHMERFAQGIEITNNQHAAQSYDKKSGQRSVIFKEDHTDSEGREVKVPDMFLINIPVFEGGVRHLLPVRLYYRLNSKSGSITWGMQLIDPNRMIRIAVETAARQAAEETALPLFFGTL